VSIYAAIRKKFGTVLICFVEKFFSVFLLKTASFPVSKKHARAYKCSLQQKYEGKLFFNPNMNRRIFQRQPFNPLPFFAIGILVLQ
jgi:hypothetical protein